jgi:hypothetical protein
VLMIPKFLENLKQGANVIEEMNVNIAAPATLLFARHTEALLREIASHDRTSWRDEEEAYWMIFNCNADEHGNYVGLFVGWVMKQDTAIETIWIAVGGEGLFWNCDRYRAAKKEEAESLLSRLRSLTEVASQMAREGVLYSFDVVTKVDASQPVLPLGAFRLGESLLVTVPREAEANKLGWGHNPHLAVLTKVLAVDIKDAEQAVGKNIFEVLLFWTLISGSYCHPAKLLFSSKSSEQDAEKRMMNLSMGKADIERFHPYSRVNSKTALEVAAPLWERLQQLSPEAKTKALSSIAAYRSALGVQRGLHHFVPTLAVVAYIAALESLIAQPSKCEGDVACSKCGPLALKHDKTGHMRTMLQAILPTVDAETRPGIAHMLKHAYQALRSAYVHSAQTEWREFAGAYLWQDITDPDEFWREERPFLTLTRLDLVVRDFIVFKLVHGNELLA